MTKFKLDPENREQQMVYDLIKNTNSSIFVTGEAGSGKTTEMKICQETIDKNFLVVAPTGIAAVAAGGRTIHSVFRIKPDDIGIDAPLDLSPDLVEAMRHVDTIIVDEVSMVSAYMIDGMDRLLRCAFRSRQPFAGKQMVFVGDPYQLPPVVKRGSAEEEMLRDIYGDGMPFFYKAKVFQKMNLPKIQLKKVYRQKDADFLRILNNIRNGKATKADLAILNKHVRTGMADGEDYGVILTAHNASADRLNHNKLASIEADEYCYEGIVEGDFNPKDSAVPLNLVLKEGAQVIFCRNDKDASRRYVNGTIAKVKKLTADTITVELENGQTFDVEQEVWESKKKVYDRKEKKLVSEVIGTYTQYPIKLAWAITIHKSQGMTLSKVVLDLSRGVFAEGQLYVALSRCSSLEGLSITHPIQPYHIRQNAEISAFAASFNDVDMIEDELNTGKALYKHVKTNDFDKAVIACLKIIKQKIHDGDIRNAALLAKKMFDHMLSDDCLLGTCNDMELIKGTSMTCNFLNAVISLYSNRFDEAIAFADLVLQRKVCFEALFIKARALYCLKRYRDADDVSINISSLLSEYKDEYLDKKYFLLIALINREIGESTKFFTKRLIQMCPEYIRAYILLRGDMFNEGFELDVDSEENIDLIISFNNKDICDEQIEQMLTVTEKNDASFKKLTEAILRLQD